MRTRQIHYAYVLLLVMVLEYGLFVWFFGYGVVTGRLLGFPHQSRPLPDDRFVYNQGGQLSPEQLSRVEGRSQRLYRQEGVRVLVVTSGVQTPMEAAKTRDAFVSLAAAGPAMDRILGLFSPTIVIHFYRNTDGGDEVEKGWSYNFWYGGWDQFEMAPRNGTLAQNVDGLLSRVYARAEEKTHARISGKRHVLGLRAVRLTLIIFILAATCWLMGFFAYFWDDCLRPSWALPLECLLTPTVFCGTMLAFSYFSGWPELLCWLSRLVVLFIIFEGILVMIRVTNRSSTNVLAAMTTAFLLLGIAGRLDPRPSYSLLGMLLHDTIINSAMMLGLSGCLLMSGRLWLNYMGEQSHGFLGAIESRLGSHHTYLCRYGMALQPTDGAPATLRQLIAMSPYAYIYWGGAGLLGYYGAAFHRADAVAAACDVAVRRSRLSPWLNRLRAKPAIRYSLAVYSYLPRGRRHLQAGDLPAARSALLRALDHMKALKPYWPNAERSGYAFQCWGLLGEVVQGLGDPEQARQWLFQSWESFRTELEDGRLSPDGVETRMRLGRYYLELGDGARAAVYFREALQCLERLGAHLAVADCALSLRDMSRKLHSEDLQPLAEGLGGPIMAAVELRPFLQDLPARKAEAAYSMSLALDQTASGEDGEAGGMRSAALAGEASPLAVRLRRLRDAGQGAGFTPPGDDTDLYFDPVQEDLWLTTVSGVAQDWERRDRETRKLATAKDEEVSDLERATFAWIARNEGMRVLPSEPDMGRALLLFALEQNRILGKRDGLADVYLCLAGLGLEEGSLLAARRLAELALGIAEEIGFLDLQRQAHLVLARALRTSGDWGAADEHCGLAIDLIEEVRQRIPNPDTRTLFTGRKIDAYAEQVLILLAASEPARALEYVERSKSRALVELLGSHKVRVRDNVDPDILCRDEELQRELAGLNNRLRSLNEETESTDDTERSARREEFLSRQTDLRRQLAAAKQEMRESTQEWATLRAVQQPPFDDPARPDDLRRQLIRLFDGSGERVVALQYFVMEEKTLIFLVPCWEDAPERLLVQESDLGAEALGRTVREDFREGIAARHGAPAFLEDLHTRLFAPVAPDLERLGATLLVLVPHGGLHALPLHALWHGDAEGRPRYLIEDYACAYAPSLSVLSLLGAKRQAGREGALVLGNPSPPGDIEGAETEAAAVAAIFGVEALLRERATEASVRASAGGCQVLHLACHAEFDPMDALQSQLVLADGPLQVDEILDLDLEASLVTLSACSSGVSAVSAGDELVGMTRAWLYAGTPSVIATQWDVLDTLSERLMAGFYRGWVQGGLSKARALQSAQVQVLEQRRRTAARRGGEAGASGTEVSPFRWAPFVLVGDPL